MLARPLVSLGFRLDTCSPFSPFHPFTFFILSTLVHLFTYSPFHILSTCSLVHHLTCSPPLPPPALPQMQAELATRPDDDLFQDIWPLHLVDLGDPEQMGVLYRLLRHSPMVVEHYLSEFVFPQTCRHQGVKLR